MTRVRAPRDPFYSREVLRVLRELVQCKHENASSTGWCPKCGAKGHPDVRADGSRCTRWLIPTHVEQIASMLAVDAELARIRAKVRP